MSSPPVAFQIYTTSNCKQILRTTGFLGIPAGPRAPMPYHFKLMLALFYAYSYEEMPILGKQALSYGYDPVTGIHSMYVPGQLNAIEDQIDLQWLQDVKDATARCLRLASTSDSGVSREQISYHSIGLGNPSSTSSPNSSSSPSSPAPQEQPGAPANNGTQLQHNSPNAVQIDAECSAEVRTSRARRTAPAPEVPKASRALGPRSVICKPEPQAEASCRARAAPRPRRHAGRPSRYAC